MTHTMNRRALLGTAAALTATFAMGGRALADFPNRPISLIVPFAPGGSFDTTGRLVAEGIAPIMGQPVVVENRPGASGIVGLASVANMSGDGYSLVLGGLTPQILVQGLHPDLPFDPAEDFIPVALVASVPLVLVAAGQLGVNSLEEFVNLMRAEPRRHNFSSAGNGTSGHIAAQHFVDVAELDVNHIPYGGSAAGLVDLLAGRVSFAVDVPSVVAQHIRAGNLTGLAVLSDQRTPTLPDVPTMQEAGFGAVNNLEPWQAIMAPKGTPIEVIEQLNAAINTVLAQPETMERFASIDLAPMGGTAEKAARFFREENDRWVPLVRAMNIDT